MNVAAFKHRSFSTSQANFVFSHDIYLSNTQYHFHFKYYVNACAIYDNIISLKTLYFGRKTILGIL